MTARRYPFRPLPAKPKRHTQLGPAEVRLLDDWGKALRSTFPDSFGPFLVGSAITRPDWRDIDVRIVLPDDVFDRLASAVMPRRLNLMLTLWGRQVTGLPIDCQVQPRRLANERYPFPQHPRNPLGLRGSDGIEGC